jgi:hypothetical protein
MKYDCAYHIINCHSEEREMIANIAVPSLDMKLTTPDGIIDLVPNTAPRIESEDIKSIQSTFFEFII